MTMGPEPTTRIVCRSVRRGMALLRGLRPGDGARACVRGRRWNRCRLSLGPGAASGWNWTEKASRPTARRPSTERSFRLTCVTSARGRVEAAVGHGVVVVLAGDLDATGGQVVHGVVGAVVAERQLDRGGAERAGQQLVAQADAEQRHVGRQQPAHGGHQVRQRGRVAGPVAQEDALGRRRPAARRRRVGAGNTRTRQPASTRQSRMLFFTP